MQPILDPRRGDFEDDALSTKRRSLLSLFGKLLVEISLPKLALVWLFILVIPSCAIGARPRWWQLFGGARSNGNSSRTTYEIWSVVLLAAVVWPGLVWRSQTLALADEQFLVAQRAGR